MIIGFLLLFSGLNGMGDVSKNMVEEKCFCGVEYQLFILGCISVYDSRSRDKH